VPIEVRQYNLPESLERIHDFFYDMYAKDHSRLDIEDHCFDLNFAIMVAKAYEEDIELIKKTLGPERYREIIFSQIVTEEIEVESLNTVYRAE
jgi:hypothetical protein